MSLFFKTMNASGAAFRMRGISELLFQHLAAYLTNHKIEAEPSWLPVIFSLQDGDSKSVGQLALEIGYSHVAIVKLIKQLQAARWVEIFVDPNDRRKKMISIHGQSADRLEALLAKLEDYEQALQEYINQEAAQLQGLKTLLFSHN